MKRSKIFLISDTHFGHEGVCRFLRANGEKLRPWDNPQEMDEFMIEQWNSRVSDIDIVYHLGDVVINRRALQTLERLNGRKVLIKGNHDIFKLHEYSKYFDDIRAYHRLNDCFLSHIPMHPSQLYRWRINIHGHLHSNFVELENGNQDPRYISVCVEHTNYAPLCFDEFEEYAKKQVEQNSVDIPLDI